MIEVEGYKAFHGSMKITPVASSGMEPFEIEADWLYKPEYGCWYGNGNSYPEEICEPVEKTGKEMLEELGYEERNSRLFVSWAYDSPKSYSFEIQTNGDVKYITQDAFCGASYVMLPPEEIHAMHHLLEERGL